MRHVKLVKLKNRTIYIVRFIGDHWAKGLKGQYLKVGGGPTPDVSQARLVRKTVTLPWTEERPVWGPDGTTGEMWVAYELIPAPLDLIQSRKVWE